MTIEQIRYFLALAERLNFRSVAECFFITQPTLSRQIANMEKELGTQLFFRKNPSVELTAAGKVLSEALPSVYRDYERAIRKAREVGEEGLGHLSIALEEDQTATPALLETVRHFSASYPDIHVSIQRASFIDLRKGLLDGSFDLINAVYLDGRYLENFTCVTVALDDACLAISRELAAGYPSEIDAGAFLELVSKTPLNMIEDTYFLTTGDATQQLEKNLNISIPPECIHFVGDPLSIPLQISAGLCTTVLNSSHIASADANIALLRIAGANRNQYRKVLAYAPENRNPALQAFLDIFLNLY